jgi:hypothetical protein
MTRPLSRVRERARVSGVETTQVGASLPALTGATPWPLRKRTPPRGASGASARYGTPADMSRGEIEVTLKLGSRDRGEGTRPFRISRRADAQRPPPQVATVVSATYGTGKQRGDEKAAIQSGAAHPPKWTTSRLETRPFKTSMVLDFSVLSLLSVVQDSRYAIRMSQVSGHHSQKPSAGIGTCGQLPAMPPVAGWNVVTHSGLAALVMHACAGRAGVTGS